MELSIVGPVNSLSYGLVTQNINYALNTCGVKTSIFPIGPIELAEEKLSNGVQKSLNNSQFWNYNAPSIRIFHQHSLDMFPGKQRIGWPIFELDTFNKLEQHHLSSCDNLIVCSEWAKNVIRANNIGTDVTVVPLGVDTEVFYPLPNASNDKTIFLNVGKLEIRKGHDAIIEAFNNAFTEQDNVELWMMWYNPVIERVYGIEKIEEWCKYYINTKLGSKIKFINPVRNHSEMRNIMQMVDYGVFPSRAEGWNLPALEMMACGKTNIITNYSAHTEYANETNSILLSVNETEPAYDGHFFTGQGNWGVINIDELTHAMRYAHTNNTKQINKHALETAKKFSWKNAANIIVNNFGK